MDRKAKKKRKQKSLELGQKEYYPSRVINDQIYAISGGEKM